MLDQNHHPDRVAGQSHQRNPLFHLIRSTHPATCRRSHPLSLGNRKHALGAGFYLQGRPVAPAPRTWGSEHGARPSPRLQSRSRRTRKALHQDCSQGRRLGPKLPRLADHAKTALTWTRCHVGRGPLAVFTLRSLAYQNDKISSHWIRRELTFRTNSSWAATQVSPGSLM